jgi:hypothetical protein
VAETDGWHVVTASNNKFCESVASAAGSMLRGSRAHRSDLIVSLPDSCREAGTKPQPMMSVRPADQAI